jgi:hypothetical protein
MMGMESKGLYNSFVMVAMDLQPVCSWRPLCIKLESGFTSYADIIG